MCIVCCVRVVCVRAHTVASVSVAFSIFTSWTVKIGIPLESDAISDLEESLEVIR